MSRSAKSLAFVIALALPQCSAQAPVSSKSSPLTLAADAWTSRDVWSLRDVGWSSQRKLSSAQLQQVVAERSAQGMIPINLGAVVDGAPQFSIVWRDNVDGRAWHAHWDLSSEQYGALWDQYKNEGFRPLNLTSYRNGDRAAWAGVWIENREGLGWSSYRGLTSDDYAARFEELRGKGYRPIDIDAYDTGSGLRFATIWYENVENIAWAQLRNMSREQYQARLDEYTANGYLIIDYDEYGSNYAAIWEQPVDRPAYAVRTSRGERDFANLWRQYRDEGLRPVHVEDHDGNEFAGIWVENSARYLYPRKTDIDTAITNYRNANSLPGISVAVLRASDVFYQRGFGWADENDEKAANAGTVYTAASVSKVFGGTLAAKLEETRALTDGTPVTLDLRQPTASFLPGLPAHHTHTVEQLTAHLGCVAHYDTTPSIENQTQHYASARAAVESIWGVPLVNGCNVGQDRSYSTGGFTFVGAVLEAVSGRNINDLIATELAGPFGLTSLRSQWATGTLPENYERAAPYNDSNTEISYEDNTWKVLGGGLELNVIDLARFGGLVMSGQIVSPNVRDNRLFSPVAPGCIPASGGICSNGVAWELGDSNGHFVAQHNGSVTGARSFIRIYPNDDLVVAIMSNRTKHNPDIDTLGDSIGNIVLAP